MFASPVNSSAAAHAVPPIPDQTPYVSVKNPKTIADGGRTPSPGELTFAVIRADVADMLTVSDKDLIRTMRFLFERVKLVVEPTGALGLAAAFRGKVDVKGNRVGVILSGSNVDLEAALELFRRFPAWEPGSGCPCVIRETGVTSVFRNPLS
jgi:threonine dehydratase